MYCYRCHEYAGPMGVPVKKDACSCGSRAFVEVSSYNSGKTPSTMRASFMGDMWRTSDDGTTDRKDGFWEDFA